MYILIGIKQAWWGSIHYVLLEACFDSLEALFPNTGPGENDESIFFSFFLDFPYDDVGKLKQWIEQQIIQAGRPVNQSKST